MVRYRRKVTGYFREQVFRLSKDGQVIRKLFGYTHWHTRSPTTRLPKK